MSQDLGSGSFFSYINFFLCKIFFSHHHQFLLQIFWDSLQCQNSFHISSAEKHKIWLDVIVAQIELFGFLGQKSPKQSCQTIVEQTSAALKGFVWKPPLANL